MGIKRVRNQAKERERRGRGWYEKLSWKKRRDTEKVESGYCCSRQADRSQYDDGRERGPVFTKGRKYIVSISLNTQICSLQTRLVTLRVCVCEFASHCFQGVMHPSVCIFLYTNLYSNRFLLDAFERTLSLSRNKTLLYMFRPNKYFIQIQQNLGSDDTLWILFSSHSPILCYPAQSSLFVCLYPLSPMKENWKQRLQLVRQLDSCFVSSTHPLSHTLIAILSSPISHLPFTCSFYVFFLIWRGVLYEITSQWYSL